MRKKLVQMDAVEAVIGIAKNLFYNSPMEACVVICRMTKPVERRGRVLFIDAKKLVTRKNSESYLEDEHIKTIVNCYNEFKEIDGFSSIASIDEIVKNNGTLGVPKYVRKGETESLDATVIEDTLGEWMAGFATMHEEYAILTDMISDEEDETNG
jgi:type I restriction enzyme M protein